MEKPKAKEGEAVTPFLAVRGVRADKEEHDKANDEEGENPGEVGLVLDLEGVELVQDHVAVEAESTRDTADGPGREHDAVEGTNVVRTPHVGEEGRDGAETGSVASGEEPHNGPEATVAVGVDEGGKDGDDDDLNAEGDEEDGLASGRGVEVVAAAAKDLDHDVRDHGEEKTANTVEDTVDGDDVGALVGGLLEQVLSHV